MRISDWSSDVCSSDLPRGNAQSLAGKAHRVVVPRLQAQRARHPVLEQAALERSGHRLDDDLARIDPRLVDDLGAAVEAAVGYPHLDHIDAAPHARVRSEEPRLNSSH